MKKLSKLLLLILIVGVIAAVATSCSTTPTLAVKDDAQPQLVHVLGEELDLSKGVLLVTTGDKTEEVKMDAEGVEISGYDNTKLGEQTVTVSYGGASTTVTVTVVERMQVVDYVADYLVGDDFDKSKGRLRITRNDGTTYSVILSNSSVFVEKMNSSAAGTVNVKAKYVNGEESYEALFPVTVHEVESVTLRAPNKKAYNSHEKNLVLDGGYLTLSGNGGKVVRDVKLSDAGVEISGFDLSIVNADKPTDNQRITVKYDNELYYYDIKITYTGVSMWGDNVDKFAALDWEAETAPEITEELGELSLELMAMYVDLSKADSLLIKEDDLLQVARTAITYACDVWLRDVAEFEDAFVYYNDIFYGSGLSFTCQTRAAVVAAIESLQITDRPIYTLYDQIVAIAEIESIKEEILSYISAPILDPETFSMMIPMFEHMLDFYDNYLTLIPANWKELDPTSYKDGIESVYAFIKDGGYINTENYWIYEQAANWLDNYEQVRHFDALYAYYFGLEDVDAVYLLSYVTLPSGFDELVERISTLLSQLNVINSGYESDTTGFFYNYLELLDYVEVIVSVSEDSPTEDQMRAVFYYSLPVNAVFSGYDTVVSFSELVDSLYYDGVVMLSHALLDVEAYTSLMDAYMAAIKITEHDENYLTNPEYATAVKNMLACFISLSDVQQSMFLGSLMPYYASGAPTFSFDKDDLYYDYTSVFNKLINEYFESTLESEYAREAYASLMLANEMLIRKYDFTDPWIDEFKTVMQSVEANLALLDESERESFLGYFGDVKTKCDNALVIFANGELDPTLGEWSTVFDALDEAIAAMNDASYVIDQGVMDEEGYYFYNIFFSAYERAKSLGEYIVANAPEDIVNAYLYARLYVIEYETEEGIDSYSYSYDYLISSYRYNFMIYVINVVGDISFYNELGYPTFFNTAYDLLVPYFNSLYYEDYEFVADKDKVLAAIDAYVKLSDDAKLTHMMMEGGIYSSLYSAIDKFVVESRYPTAVANVMAKLTEVDFVYIMVYYYVPLTDASDEASLAELSEIIAVLEESITQLEDVYEALEGDNKTAFSDFEDVYAACVALYKQLLEDAKAIIPAA